MLPLSAMVAAVAAERAIQGFLWRALLGHSMKTLVLWADQALNTARSCFYAAFLLPRPF